MNSSASAKRVPDPWRARANTTGIQEPAHPAESGLAAVAPLNLLERDRHRGLAVERNGTRE